MFTAFLILVLLFAASFLFKVARDTQVVEIPASSPDRYGDRKPARTAGKKKRRILFASAAGALTVSVFLLGFSTIKIVNATDVAVPVTFGKTSSAVQSGPHLKAPWTSYKTLPKRQRTITVFADVRTAESGTVNVEMQARWSTDAANAEKLYTQQRTDNEEKIEADLITPNVASAAGAFYGTLTNYNSVVGKLWADNAAGTEKIAVRYLSAYGVHVDSVKILSVKPDEQTENNIAAYAAQPRLTAIAVEGQKTAKEEAKRQKAVAQGLLDAAEKLKDLTPIQLEALKVQAAERIQKYNADHGVPTYVVPGSDGEGVSVLAK